MRGLVGQTSCTVLSPLELSALFMNLMKGLHPALENVWEIQFSFTDPSGLNLKLQLATLI